MVYGSSEAFFGFNTRAAGEDPAYAIIPTMALVEFLPVDEAGSPPEGAQPLLADRVNVKGDNGGEEGWRGMGRVRCEAGKSLSREMKEQALKEKWQPPTGINYQDTEKTVQLNNPAALNRDVCYRVLFILSQFYPHPPTTPQLIQVWGTSTTYMADSEPPSPRALVTIAGWRSASQSVCVLVR